MIAAATLLPSLDLGRTVLDALLETTVRGSLLLLAAAGLTVALRRASAAFRHLIWTLAVGGVLVLPALWLALPRWRVPVRVPPAAVEAAVSTIHAPAIARGVVRREAEEVLPSETRPALRRSAASRIVGDDLLVALWLIGVLALLAWLAVGRVTVRILACRAVPPAEPGWSELAAQVAAELGIRRTVRLRVSDRVGVPVTWGVFRPTVLLPTAAHLWPAERMRMVLLHEMAHVRRLDALTQALAQMCQVLCWFNPLVWLAAHRMRVERERACDDRVLAHGTLASSYARDLLEIARAGMAAHPRIIAALALACRTELEGRMLAILDEHQRRTGVRPHTGAAMATVAAGLVLPLATVQVVPKPSSGPASGSRVEPALHAGPRVGDAALAAAHPPALPRFAPPNAAATMIAVARTAAAVRSETDRATLLVALAARAPLDPAVFDEVLHAAATLHNDRNRQRVLAAVAARAPLPRSTQQRLVEQIDAIASETGRSRLLAVLAARGTLPDGAPPAGRDKGAPASVQ
ncbi:MAG: M56 family metallopeptidase [Gemmatimonadaceae bacterium]|nr:M56 family metallopeptidase [Gemmatimonadaceae bacterium]